jgi:hypothetical protein
MVLGRDSTVEHNATPWRMEMDYENNISLYEANKKNSIVEPDRNRVRKLMEGKLGKFQVKRQNQRLLMHLLGKANLIPCQEVDHCREAELRLRRANPRR